jgi:serine protease AprX
VANVWKWKEKVVKQFLNFPRGIRPTLVFLILLSVFASTYIGNSSSASFQDDDDDQQHEIVSHKISKRIRERKNSPKTGNKNRQKVLVKLKDDSQQDLSQLLAASGIRAGRQFKNFKSTVIEATEAEIQNLAANEAVAFIANDDQVEALGHLTATTGADLIRQTFSSAVKVQAGSLVEGNGITIAIIDSGIDATHTAFRGKDGKSRIRVSKDFTGQNRTDDPFGHGTFVAAAAAGTDKSYNGIANAAELINLRVLNSEGVGEVSRLLEALDWVAENYKTHNIRVVNMSLGVFSAESYKDSPLCQAVRKLVDLGIVVVTAAGNSGTDEHGQKIYGQISTPANEPSALTVGASDTLSTNSRKDDSIAKFSSRGPTRTFQVDENGMEHFDNLVKPDLVAPGTELVSASSKNNLLANSDPSSRVGDRWMIMSGTSVSAPVVSGAVALLLQINPSLTPNLVKTTLMYSAQQIKGFNTFEQGAGQLNIEGAARLAANMRTDLAKAKVGSELMIDGKVPTPKTTIANHTFEWSQGIVTKKNIAFGPGLVTKVQKFHARGASFGTKIEANAVRRGIITTGKLRTYSTTTIRFTNALTVSTGSAIFEGNVFIPTVVLETRLHALPDGISLGDGIVKGVGIYTGRRRR